MCVSSSVYIQTGFRERERERDRETERERQRQDTYMLICIFSRHGKKRIGHVTSLIQVGNRLNIMALVAPYKKCP